MISKYMYSGDRENPDTLILTMYNAMYIDNFGHVKLATIEHYSTKSELLKKVKRILCVPRITKARRAGETLSSGSPARPKRDTLWASTCY